MTPPNDTSPARAPALPIEIREMELDDMPAVFALGEQLFTADRWPNLYRTWDEYELVGLYYTDGDFCLVAEYERQIIGFALGSLIDKRKSAWKYGYLRWLGVDPVVTGRRVARRLLDQLTELFREAGARILMVDTQADNDPALRFFGRAGFGDPQQHVYLSKNLERDSRKRGRKRTKGGDKAKKGRKEKIKRPAHRGQTL